MTRSAIIASRIFSDGEILEDSVVVVDGGRIVEILPTARWAPGEFGRVYDLRGCTLLPGLVDAHIHLGPEDDAHVLQGHVPARLLESPTIKVIKSVVDLHNLLRAGFTAARDVGGARAVEIRKAIDRGLIPGPRLRCTGRVLTTIGGLEDHPYLPPSWVSDLSDLARPCGDVNDCVRAVREQRRLGADFIKVFVTGLDTVQQFSDVEIQTIVSEARRVGLEVAGHALGGTGVSAAVRAPCYTVEHGSYMTEEDCRLMVEHQTIFVPDLAFAYVYASQREADVPESLRCVEQKRLAEMSSRTRMAYEMGVKIAAGTDFGLRSFARHGPDNLLALLLLHEAGLPPTEVLKAATIHGAETLRMDKVIGRVAPGYFADMIAVRGNPAEELSDVRNLEFVMKDGQVVVDEVAA